VVKYLEKMTAMMTENNSLVEETNYCYYCMMQEQQEKETKLEVHLRC
jgi:hypothetical protein